MATKIDTNNIKARGNLSLLDAAGGGILWQIKNVLTPSASTDVATKGYVDGFLLPFNQLTNATATRTLDNANFGQTWNWSTLTTQTGLTTQANAITTGSILSITSSSALNTSTNGLVYIANTSAAITGTILRVASNSTAGSGMVVLGNGNVGIGNISPVSTLDIQGAIVNRVLVLGNLSAGVLGGTAAAGVDIYSTISIAQTTVAVVSMSIPNPSNTTAGRRLNVCNIGTAAIIVANVVIHPATMKSFIWTGSTWTSDTLPSGNVVVSASRDFRASDHGRILECTATVTLTNNGGLPPGFYCQVIVNGAFSVTPTAGSGTVFNTLGGTKWTGDGVTGNCYLLGTRIVFDGMVS